MGRPPICPTTSFIELWEQSASVREAARRMGLTNRQATVRANYLRSLGHRLKRMEGGAVGVKRVTHDKEVEMMERTN